MTVNMNVEVTGIRDAIALMSKTNKVLANELRKEARTIMKPLVQDAVSNIPSQALSNMDNRWVSKKTGIELLPWDANKARKYVKAKTSQKKPEKFGEYTRNLAVFYVSWAGGVNMLFDMAGRRRGSILANNLTDKFGPPSRIMYPAAERNKQAIETEMANVVAYFMAAYNREILGIR